MDDGFESIMVHYFRSLTDKTRMFNTTSNSFDYSLDEASKITGILPYYVENPARLTSPKLKNGEPGQHLIG